MEEENRGHDPLAAKAMHSLNTHNGAWSNRVESWPLQERRLIFACKNEDMYTSWSESFRQILEDASTDGDED